MNHTIKGVIIVVAITSMLFMGATTVPIMQNSFAYKKSDFKEAERDTNININTNSADSISSSDAIADNTNNINNVATASNSQEQSACAVALTCPEGSTTIIPPTTGTLVISKVCDPDCPGTDFRIIVFLDDHPQADFTLQSGQTRVVTLGPGTFGMVEAFPNAEFTGDCAGTISAGQTLHCTITNFPPA